MILFPNAKINIGLNILRRRPDGYHDISTVMYPAGWKDILEIIPSKSGKTTLTVTGRRVDCPAEKNLVMKAYRRMAAEVELPEVDIYLHKIIPDGAGLGGGSADATFTLIGLNKLFDLGFNDKQLASMAGSLGADCAFFVYNRPMLCEGIGLDMSPVSVDLRHYNIVIVKPPISIPTAQAYGNCSPKEPEVPLPDLLRLPVDQWRHTVHNDFEAGIVRLHPEIGQIEQRLYDMGAVYSAMSGSGSSVFGLFDHDILADDIKTAFPECDTFVPQPQ